MWTVCYGPPRILVYSVYQSAFCHCNKMPNAGHLESREVYVAHCSEGGKSGGVTGGLHHLTVDSSGRRESVLEQENG